MNNDQTQINNNVDIDTEIEQLLMDVKLVNEEMISMHTDVNLVLSEENNNLDLATQKIEATYSDLDKLEEETGDKLDTLAIDYSEKLAKADEEDEGEEKD